jgi:hypothetical protein
MVTLMKVYILMYRYMSKNSRVPGAAIVDYVSVNQIYYPIGSEAYACIRVHTLSAMYLTHIYVDRYLH